jgi:hypothetical protein
MLLFVYNGMGGDAEMKSIEKAIDRAIEECLNEGVLFDILSEHKDEVKEACLMEYKEEMVINAFKEEAEERMSLLYKFLRESNRLDEWECSISDRSLRKRLLSELPDDYS